MSSFFSTLKRGQIYLQTWPLEAKLGIIFPENRIIKATKFAQKFMPFMAVFSTALCQDRSYCISDCYFDRTLCVSDAITRLILVGKTSKITVRAAKFSVVL